MGGVTGSKVGIATDRAMHVRGAAKDGGGPTGRTLSELP